MLKKLISKVSILITGQEMEIRERKNQQKNFNKYIVTKITDKDQTIKELNDQLNKVKSEADDKINKLEQQINAMQSEYYNLKINDQTKIDELNEQLNILKEESNNQINSLKTQLIEKDDTIKDLNQQIDTIKSETETKITEFNEQINNSKASADNQISLLQTQLAEKDNIIKDLNQQIDIIKSETETKIFALEADNKKWESLTIIYKPVLESMLKCATFNSILQDNFINGTDTKDLFKIIKAIGTTIDFAKKLHTCALNVKQSNSEPITSEEAAVYKSLNECYRQVWQINFDVFVMPGNKSVNEEFFKIPFDKNEAVSMKNPNDKNWKFTQAVYVPLLKARNGDMHTKAQVQAGNM